ncbi:MAG: ABC transporter permease [Planctomycetes bacterium]|nr:ABC transporter permease [Planctomycetota bacterium]
MTDNILMALKPIWLLGCGAGLGLAVLLVIGGIVSLFRGGATAVRDVAFEIVVWPVLMLSVLLAMFAATAAGLDMLGFRFFDQKRSAWESVLRLNSNEVRELKVAVPRHDSQWSMPILVQNGELGELQLDSDRSVILTINQPDGPDRMREERILLQAGEPFQWTRTPDAFGPLAGGIEKFYFHVSDDQDTSAQGGAESLVRKIASVSVPLAPAMAALMATDQRAVPTMTAVAEENRPAQVQIVLKTQPVVPQASIIPITAIGLVGYVGFFLLLQGLFPKLSAVAIATSREAMGQPLYYLLLGAGAVFLLAMLFTPFFTFGEDVRQYKDSGLTAIMVFSIFFAVWTASVSVADEIEGRTALTVLSKPIGRREFIIGKYLGIIAPVAVNFILIGTFFLILTSYKVVYDARESADPNVLWQQCYAEMAQTAPGLVVYFMEVAVLASISVAIATRLPLLPNLVICTSIYMVGHLLPLLVKSTASRFEIVAFMGQLFATVLPVLDHFNVYAAVAAGIDIPLSYVGWVALYSLNYIAIAMLFALALFEDRDLA